MTRVKSYNVDSNPSYNHSDYPQQISPNGLEKEDIEKGTTGTHLKLPKFVPKLWQKKKKQVHIKI